MKNKYKFTVILSTITESQLLTFFEGTEVKLVTNLSMEGVSSLSEEELVKELNSKIGGKIPDTDFEIIGYENISKVIEHTTSLANLKEIK